MRIFLIFGAVIALTYAQTCTEEQSNAPCDADMPCDPASNSVCDVANEHCCPNSLFTTLAPVVGADTSSTFNPLVTVPIIFQTIRPSVTGSTTCVDKVNPSTGTSDCSRRAALCNDVNYQAVMNDQCPKTCGRCSTTNSSTNSITSANCVDKVNPSTGTSDCTRRESLCNDPTYQAIMTQQCPKTCGRCSTTNTANNGVNNFGFTISSVTSSGSCTDLINPRTGRSDCQSNANLCNNSNYASLMRIQCPRTCGFCGSSTTTVANSIIGGITSTTNGACFDRTNPRTGTSDCARLSNLCNNQIYQSIMRTQCPRTCGFC